MTIPSPLLAPPLLTLSAVVLFAQVILSVGFTKAVSLLGILHFPVSVLASFVNYYLNQLGLD